MNKPRIMQLLPALGDGGVERGTIEMADFLRQNTIENWVVSSGGALEAPLNQTGAQHISMPVGSKSPLSILRNARHLARLIDTYDIDIVHARSRAPAWVGYLACRWARKDVRFFTTFHGVYSHANRWKRAYNSVMLKGPLVVANSGFIRNHIISIYNYPPEKIIVAERGVDTDAFNPDLIGPEHRAALRVELGAAEGAPLVVIVGRITDWKGHRYLIDALVQCTRKDVCLAIVGSGTQSVIDDINAQISKLDLVQRVKLIGTRRDIPAIMAAADLAISSSTRPEAFGRVAIEAQAMETPIIATNHGGSLETVIPGKTGWLIPPADSMAMANAIDAALSDMDDLATMGKQGREHVLEHFTMKKMLENEFSAYQRIMTES